MNLTNQIYPTQEQLGALLGGQALEDSVTMLNIIKYKAEEVDGQPAKDAYRKYVDSFKLYIKDLGAEVIWIGDVTHTIIGSTEAPDLVFLVKWIKLQQFVDMVSDPKYLAFASHRNMSIQYGGLWACREKDV